MPDLPKNDSIIRRDDKFYCAECDAVTFDNWYEVYNEAGAVFCEVCGIELTKDLKLKSRGVSKNQMKNPPLIQTPPPNPPIDPFGNNFKIKDLTDEFNDIKNEISEAVENAKVKWNKFWDRIKVKFKEIGERIKKKFDEFGKKMDEKFKDIDKKWQAKQEEIKQKMNERNEKWQTKSEEIKQRMDERNERFRTKNISRTNSKYSSKSVSLGKTAPDYYNVKKQPSTTTHDPNIYNANVSKETRNQAETRIARRPNFDAITGKRIIYEEPEEVVATPRFDSKTGLPLDGITQNSNDFIPKFDMKTGKPIKDIQPIQEEKVISEPIISQKVESRQKINTKPENRLKSKVKKVSDNKMDESIRIQSEKIFTVLEPEIRERLLALQISENEKDNIAKSLIYVNYNVRVKYLEEFEHFTSQSDEKTKNLIDKIEKLPIPEEQKNILINQLDYLIDEKKEEFVDYLEQGIESEMEQIETDISQFEKDIEDLKSDEEIIPKQKIKNNNKKRTLIPE